MNTYLECFKTSENYIYKNNGMGVRVYVGNLKLWFYTMKLLNLGESIK